MARPQILTWQVTVGTAGTPVNLQPGANSRPTFESLHVQPLLTNTDDVYLMGAGTISAAGQSRGNAWRIPSPISYGSNALEVTFGKIPIVISDLWLDSDVDGEGVIIAGEPTDP